MILEEADIGDTAESKRDALRVPILNKKEVILKDEHNDWCHGELTGETGKETYKLTINDARGERRLHYHDLQQLLVRRYRAQP